MDDRRPLILIAALILVGCVEDTPLLPLPSWCEAEPQQVATFESSTMWSYDVELGELCSGSWTAAHAHTDWVAALWGEREDFGYAIYDSGEHPCWPCPTDFQGCVRYESVHSTVFPHRHEITHAVRPGSCYPLIEEGFAVLYGDPFAEYSSSGDINDVLQLIDERGNLGGLYYGASARFVAYLIERGGVESLHRFCGDDIDSSAAFAAAVEETYGESLDAILQAFAVDYPDDNKFYPRRLRQDQACEVGTQPVLTSPASWTMDMRCGSPGVEGRMGEWLMTHQLIEIPEDGQYRVTATTDRNIIIAHEFRNCTREGMGSIYMGIGYHWFDADKPEVWETEETPAGTYVLRLRVEGADAATDIDDTLMLDMNIEPIL